MNVEHFVLAKEIITDQETNLVSAIGIIEDLTVQLLTLQTPDPPMAVALHGVVYFIRENDQVGAFEEEIELNFFGPMGQFFQQKQKIHFQANHTRIRMRLPIAVPVVATGQYKFEIKLLKTGVVVTRQTKITVLPAGVPKSTNVK